MADYRTPIPALLAATLQSGMNAVLVLDEGSSSRLRRLEGRLLKLVLDGAGITFYFTAGPHGIQVSLDPPAVESGVQDDEAETTITGTPAALFTLAAAEAAGGWSAPNSRVSIAGDATLARDFERLFSKLEPDIESALSGLFGDVVAHQVALGMREGSRRAREAATAASDVVGEMLREGARGGKSGPLIGSAEARRFSEGVDALRDAIERLEARIRVLADARQNPPPGNEGDRAS